MEDPMFNSPLQYCAKCKQYVELDQSKEECVALHDCGGVDCPLVKMFKPPTAMDKAKPAVAPEPPTASKPGK
jgi:hypothetical protein